MNCRITFCGDGIRQSQAGELCDDGNLEHADACTADCVWARCGDGVKRKDSRAGSPDHEDCDDGNAQDRDFCSNDCAAARCGDGWVLEGVELCDDGNTNDEDDCSNTCGLGVVELDSGTGYTCGRTERGRVMCWGGNGWTESGSQNPANPTLTLEAQRIDDIGATRRVRAMARKTCVVTEDGRSICWGSGCGVGALGVSEAGNTHNAQRRAIEGLEAVPTDFAGGTCWTCALLESGEVSCWGEGSDGELGNGEGLISPTPVTVSGLPKIKQIDGRWAQICAVSEAGEVFCWGRNDNYQILPQKHAYVFESGSLNAPAELPLFGVSEPF